MRKTKLFTTMIAAFLLAGMVFAQPLAASEPSVIRVSGAASVTMAPDVASVSFRAITTDDDRQTAITDNNNLMSDILQILRQRGVSDDDIRTSAFSVNAIFETIVDDEGYMHTIPAGYRATNNVTANIRDLGEIGGIISAVLATGASLTGGPTFRVSDTSAGYYEAIAMASGSALNRARAIAGALDVQIVGVISVDETAGTNMPVVQGGVFAAPEPVTGAAAPGILAAPQIGGGDMPVEPGTITVTARVNIVFEIE
jgi:uncharacterized protein YggE